MENNFKLAFCMTILLLSLFLPGTFLLTQKKIITAIGENWLTGWRYRRYQQISSTTDITDYQMKIVAYYSQLPFEFGTIDLENTIDHGVIKTITFKQTYSEPVVVAYIATRNDDESVEVRVTEVTSTSCKIFMQEPDNGDHPTETVCYIVMEKGAWTVNGLKMEAGKVETDSVHREGNSYGGVTVTFSQTFSSTPAILHCLNTYNNQDFMTTVAHSESATSFKVQQEAAGSGSPATTETIAWIAVEAGKKGILPHHIYYETGFESDGGSDGVDNGTPHTITFSQTFNKPPVIVVKGASGAGTDGYWARSAGTWSKSTHTVFAEEDQVGNSERGHVDEYFAYWALVEYFEGNVVYLNEHARMDFADLRFTAADGVTPLSYWIEEKVDGDYAIIWVKIPQIPASGEVTIYIYYGNSGALSESNVDETFLEVIHNSLEIYYSFDEGGGTTVNDKSGNNYKASLFGSSWVNGKFGDALYFDGNDYVAIHDLYYSQSGQLDSFTVFAWVRVPADGGDWSIIDFDRSEYFTCCAGIPQTNYQGEGDYVGFHTKGENGVVDDMWGSSIIRDNQWHSVTWVFDSQETYDKKIYIDGALDSQKDAYPTGTKVGSGTVRYGFLGDGSEATSYNGGRNNRYYEGYIDELYLFNRALTEQEIALLSDNYGYVTENYPHSVLVRKYVDPAPTYGSWSEEEEELGLPEVETLETFAIENSVTLKGEITSIGAAQVDMRGFEWGTEPGVYTEEWIETGTFDVGIFTHTLNDLPTGVYYYRAKAHNSYGWGYGQEKSFVVTYWLSGWQYRKSHEIQGSTAGAVTDYQVRIKVHYGSEEDSGQDVYLNGKCRTDFGDIRFTASDGQTLLDYWMDEKVDGDYAVFWVEVPSIPASPGATTIYIYYGNPSATSESDGKATFDLFSDFETGMDGWSDWSSIGRAERTSRYSYDGSYSVVFKEEIDESPGQYTGIQRNDIDLTNKRIDFWYFCPDDTWDSYKVLKVTAGSTEITIRGDFDGRTWYHHYLTGQTGTFLGFRQVCGNGNNEWWIYVDRIIIRKYVSPEPSHGVWGSEEEGVSSNRAPAPPTLDDPVVNAHFDPSASVTFSWIFNDPDAEDSQSAYQFQLDDNNDFSSPIIDTGKISSSESSTTQILPSTIGLYYWRVKTWDSQDAEGGWSEARPIIVDRIKIIGGGVVNFTIDVDIGGKVWYYAVYEYDNSTFDGSRGVLYVNGFEMTWDGEKWVYAFPYSTEGNQMTFHITGVLDNQYGLTEINNQAGDIIINWAT
ncbi:MAG: DUF2341 domain-containing protein, partial [Candidatus Heimdallarchaeota archaeon]